MTFWQIVVAVVLGLIANEVSDVSSWCAERVVRAAARLRYPDGERREVRLAELVGLIGTRPGKLFKLLTALIFLVAAMPAGVKRLAKSRRIVLPWKWSDRSVALLSGFGVLISLAGVVLSANIDRQAVVLRPPGFIGFALFFVVWGFTVKLVRRRRKRAYLKRRGDRPRT
ncbi:hypothetical protein [Actinocrispum wychmicini]|uniref:Uncharacterized protein n=1 Tax=Actinocrispum wychmicini TaxID=1213861 RepID=A0A4R2K549_9PSEU|nr:hypothetical protein [Actinocrispum wychmicini]TCO64939.1 hypothetical protein EV192_101723 [Actinocrispum wychmicini]